MRRVVVTGMGIVSSLGHAAADVARALRDGVSGLRAMPAYAELGLRSQVAGAPDIDLDATIERKARRFMGDAAAYAWIAMRDAIADAGLALERIRHPRVGVVAGSGGGSAQWQIETGDLVRTKGVRRVGPYMVPRTMCSTVSATLATAFGILGVSYSISAACATSAHCIGAAADLIRHGAQDIVFAGGGEELHWGMTAQFDAMGALSSAWNEAPHAASRPYDAGRDGFVIAAGGGMLVLEDYEHAKARGARIHAELVGYGVTSDGTDMVAPSGEGAARCMRMALAAARAPIDYVNTHGTATPLNDSMESRAVASVLGLEVPCSSTKPLTGHTLGAAGALEAALSYLTLTDAAHRLPPHWFDGQRDEALPPVRLVAPGETGPVQTVLSNSFAFGGSNAALLLVRA